MKTPTLRIIKGGLVCCVTEPRCGHGLEGYGLGQSYSFETICFVACGCIIKPEPLWRSRRTRPSREPSSRRIWER
jgi:hypothetical protein